MLAALAVVAGCGDNVDTQPQQPEAGTASSPPLPDARPTGHLEMVVQGQPGKPRVLVYTFENFWRHYSNIDSRGAIVNMSNTRGFTVMTTNDPQAINATNLAQST